MKYFLTSLDRQRRTELTIDNIVPTKTTHFKGYGKGVTFTTNVSNWRSNTTISSVQDIRYSEAVVVTQ
jgi:hypothetical protein